MRRFRVLLGWTVLASACVPVLVGCSAPGAVATPSPRDAGTSTLSTAESATQQSVEGEAHAERATRDARGERDAPRGPWTLAPVRAMGLAYREFESAIAARRVGFHILLPPSYEREPTRRYPVRYWLHGTGGGESGLRALARIFSEEMLADSDLEAIVVFPNGLQMSMWCDAVSGTQPVESVLVGEIVPLVDRDYRTIADRSARLLEGFSMGGYGAARIAFRHTGLFGAASILGAGPMQPELLGTPRAGPLARERVLREVYGGDMEWFRKMSPWRLAEQHVDAIAGSLRIHIAVGMRDETLPANERFVAHLEKLGISCDFATYEGVAHDPRALLSADRVRRAAFIRGPAR